MRIWGRLVGAAVVATLMLTGCGTSGTAASRGSGHSPAESGNGEADKSAEQVEADALAALKGASSFEVAGTVTKHGESVSLDLRLGPNGRSAGTVAMAAGKVEVIRVDGKAYLEASAGYWTSQSGLSDAMATELGNRWVILPGAAADTMTQFGLDRFTQQVLSSVHPSSSAQLHSDTLYGRPIVVVTEPDGTRLDVAGEGPPYPLRVTVPGADQATLTLSNFGTAFDITAPPTPLDLASLASLASGATG